MTLLFQGVKLSEISVLYMKINESFLESSCTEAMVYYNLLKDFCIIIIQGIMEVLTLLILGTWSHDGISFKNSKVGIYLLNKGDPLNQFLNQIEIIQQYFLLEWMKIYIIII
jgi:hypothetical protein